MDNNILFNVTPQQVELIKKYFNITIPLDDYEVCDLLDRLIDETVNVERGAKDSE